MKTHEDTRAPSRSRPNGPYLNAREAGDYLGTGERFIRRLVNERRIRFHKFGKLVRLDVADLDAFIAASAVEAKR